MPDWSVADKSPYVSVERTEFFPRYQELFGICDCRFDFEPVAYDARVMEETLDVLVVVTRNLRGVESMECLAVVFTLVENRLPIESCLCTLQYEKLEQGPVVMHRDAPLFIMVLDHDWTAAVGRPLTPTSQRLLQIASIPRWPG